LQKLTKPAEPEPLDVHLDPEALIGNARRRARQRRLRWVAVLLAVVAIVGTLFGLGALGIGPTAAARAQPGPAKHPLRNGPLTIVHGAVYAVGPNGLGRRLFSCGGRVLPGPGHCAEIESLTWSPDGRHIAFGGVSIGAPPEDDGLYVADTKTGKDRIIRPFDPPEVDWLDLSWSPDGSTLAFVVRNVIYLVRGDGSGYRSLHTGTEGHDRAPSWSPDGRRMAYAAGGPGFAVIFRIDLDGAHRRILGYGAWPAWSPAGGRIAYLAPCGIKIVSPNRKALSGCVGIHGAPVWSPDGRKIAAAVRGQGIYTMNASGRGVRLYTRTLPESLAGLVRQTWFRPAWAPRPCC
jgi:WD40 repeat protein